MIVPQQCPLVKHSAMERTVNSDESKVSNAEVWHMVLICYVGVAAAALLPWL